MERIYSALFASARRPSKPTARELTAEALAKHDQHQGDDQDHPDQHQQTGDASASASPSASSSFAEVRRSSSRDDKDKISASDIADQEEQDDRDGDVISAHRREFAQLVQLQARKQIQTSGGAVRDAVMAAARAFILAYGAKAFTAMLLASRKWSSLEIGYADAVRLLLQMDTVRFGAFVGGMVGAYRLTEVILRELRGTSDDDGDDEDTENHPYPHEMRDRAIAGGVAGLALLLDAPSRRSTIALYVFVRMLDVVGRHLTQLGKLPNWSHSTEWLFAVCNVCIMHAFMVDPTLMNRGYYHWMLNVGGMTHRGLEFTVRDRLRGALDSDGRPIAFRACQPHLHRESCTTHAMKDWVAGLARAARIYLPVHFLPAVLFRLKQLVSTPLAMTTRISYNTLCSSAFLTTYQTMVKLVFCMLRNALHRDHQFMAHLAGLLTGTSLFFEAPKRRLELMLYCASHAITISWGILQRRKLVRYIRHSEVALFCVSMALIMSRPATCVKPSYLSALRFLFGVHAI